MQTKNLRFLLGLLFAVTSLAAVSAACGDLEESCDPEVDDNCECEDEEDTSTCTTVNNGTNNNPGNNNPGNNNPGNNNPGNNNPVPDPYRFVMIEDDSNDAVNGPTAGSDIDAIGLDVDGDQVIDHWASSVEDFNIGGDNNEHIDTDDLLGAPDADCMVQNFTSLGGNAGDNYVIVGFGNGTDVTFGSGAIVQVWELGPTNCPNQASWKDDESTISVSISTDRASFTQIGTVGTGTNAVIIP